MIGVERDRWLSRDLGIDVASGAEAIFTYLPSSRAGVPSRLSPRAVPIKPVGVAHIEPQPGTQSQDVTLSLAKQAQQSGINGDASLRAGVG